MQAGAGRHDLTASVTRMTVHAGGAGHHDLTASVARMTVQAGRVAMTLLLVLQECAGGAGRRDLTASVTRMTVCAGGAGRHDQNPLVSTQAASLLDYTVDISGAADFPLVKAHGQFFRGL